MIDELNVMSIGEWNKKYPQFPITRLIEEICPNWKRKKRRPSLRSDCRLFCCLIFERIFQIRKFLVLKFIHYPLKKFWFKWDTSKKFFSGHRFFGQKIFFKFVRIIQKILAIFIQRVRKNGVKNFSSSNAKSSPEIKNFPCE